MAEIGHRAVRRLASRRACRRRTTASAARAENGLSVNREAGPGGIVLVESWR